MATTVCDFKSFLTSFYDEAVERVDFSIPAPEPPSSTPTYPKTQAAIITPASEKFAASIVELVDTACEAHSNATGATVSLRDGDMTGRKLFAVSIFPERSFALHAAPTWQNIFAFVSLHVDLLVKPCHAFGLWFDASDGVYVLDVVLCLPGRRTALELGRSFNQKSIYDLATRKGIATRSRRVRPVSAQTNATDRSDCVERSLREEPRYRGTSVGAR